MKMVRPGFMDNTLKIWYSVEISGYFGKLVLLRHRLGKLDIVRPGFGFVDNYLSKMLRFNQLGKFFCWIWSIFKKNMDKFSQVRALHTYIMVQESSSTPSLISIANRAFTMAEWIRGKQFHNFLLSAGFLQVSLLNLL